jgi:hypothetical protein
MSIASTIQKTATKMATLTKNIVPDISINKSINVLTNKWILYAVLFIGIVDLFNFYSKGDTIAIAIFFVAGFLTTYFSKNMLVILIIAIAITHIARFGSNATTEGMETEDDDEEKEGMEDEEEEEKEGMEQEDEEDPVVDEGITDANDAKKKTADDLTKISSALSTIKPIQPDDIANQTKALIEQTKKVQENMALLEPYLKKAADATASLKPEGFCDYASAYSK